MKRFILYVLAAFAFAACTQNEIEELSSNKLFVPDNISVGFENADTRIQLLNGKTVWNEGDCVSVFYRSFDNLKWQFQGQTGDRTGELKLIEGYIGNQTMDDVIIVYPYNENYLVRLADKSIEARMPATQYYRYNSYDPQSNLMIAHSTGRDFVLKNVCGWIRVELTGNGEVVRSLTLRGNNDELVAGDIAIDAAEATATFMASNGTAPGDDSEVGGDLVFEDESFTSVKLQCSGVELSSEPTAFYIALPPQTFTNGFTVEVKCQGYQPMVLQRNDAIAIERNHIQPMQVVEFEAEESDALDILNNEIWYTATDRVWPNNDWDFGATLIDNYFDYNTGEGILTFDGDVTRIPYGAFWDNWNLTSINLPNSVTEIYGSAFYNCWGLTSIYIPESVIYIEPGAFSSCGHLEKFEGWCASEDGRCLVLDNVLLAFAPAGITSYTTPSGVQTIAAYSFCNSVDLTEIVISDGVSIIGSEAFYGSRLHTVVMPD
ncbi:MAG: leucine-rich repeat protein, partial [Alistipes sp.]|nr:leucine-rich repeat protein [Alistipes sp.]